MPVTGTRGTGKVLFIMYINTRVILSSKRVLRSGVWGEVKWVCKEVWDLGEGKWVCKEVWGLGRGEMGV